MNLIKSTSLIVCAACDFEASFFNRTISLEIHHREMDRVLNSRCGHSMLAQFNHRLSDNWKLLSGRNGQAFLRTLFRRYVLSMRRRCVAVTGALAGHTRY